MILFKNLSVIDLRHLRPLIILTTERFISSASQRVYLPLLDMPPSPQHAASIFLVSKHLREFKTLYNTDLGPYETTTFIEFFLN